MKKIIIFIAILIFAAPSLSFAEGKLLSCFGKHYNPRNVHAEGDIVYTFGEGGNFAVWDIRNRYCCPLILGLDKVNNLWFTI